ncbi:MAG: AmmeMemoRadiSam system radical SAM enzyme [Chitinivibrionales bacterium]|nr:AmmeMemoRadiSam system radical SAM enzyme [Chitinivibrionales bacterium]MBD3395187.1 AmmeMemoRadiSam system radical SAM enzyme [Chitinivibrionales bacterium]
MTTRRDILRSGVSALGMLAGASCAAGAPRTMREARHWAGLGENAKCGLCPHECMLAPNATGICRVRQNRDGTLVTHGYANPCAVHVDPIEKKPLYHVTPGARAYSIAVAGCNMRCKNCQNHTISQVSPRDTSNTFLPPDRVVETALKHKCGSIAYTYSEPTVWYEYMYDTAVLARKAGLKNLMITCGYINPGPLTELAEYMDAANIDLKSFDNAIYGKLNAGRLQPVLDTITLSKKLGMWVEVTNLIVPEWTDDLAMIRKMCGWLKDSLGPDVPLHFSRFHPMHKLAHLYPTPSKTLEEARGIADEEGLHHVYVGNVAGTDSNTYCPHCGKPVVSRRGYLVTGYDIVNGSCRFCKTRIAGVWAA